MLNGDEDVVVKNSEFIESLGELHSSQDRVQLMHWALNEFADRFGTECTIWTQYDRRGSLVGAMMGRQSNPDNWRYGPIIQEHLEEHPIYHILRRSGAGPVGCKTTDFASQRALDQTPLFRNAYRHMNCRYHLALVLESPDVPRCSLTIGRNGSDYTNAQVRALQESARHFLAALGKLGRIEELERQLAGPGVLRFHAQRSRGGKWYYSLADEVTAAEVANHFGQGSEKFLVPGRIALHLENVQGTTTICCERGYEWDMTVHSEGSDQKLVLMEAGPLLRMAMACPALSPREAETARWMCEGKTNPEIGIILGISAKTVEKHIANLFMKLGVETRLAAVQSILTGLKRTLLWLAGALSCAQQAFPGAN